MADYMARPVRVASVGSGILGRSIQDEVLSEVEALAKKGQDIILTPEVWADEVAEPTEEGDYTSSALKKLKAAAKNYHTYIAGCMKRRARRGEVEEILDHDVMGYWMNAESYCFNSIILIDRNGRIVYIYDKVYPFCAEFNSADMANANFDEMKVSPVLKEATFPGDHCSVYETDFGKVSFAICFDMNFPELFRKIGVNGCELLLWSSAFDGGINVPMRAGSYNYYIVSSTCIGTGGIRVEDLDGRELAYQLPENRETVHSLEVTLDLDRQIFHRNYNEGRIRQAMEKYGDKIDADYQDYPTAEWIKLRSRSPEISIGEIIKEYGLVPLRDFKGRAEAEFIDRLRGKVYR